MKQTIWLIPMIGWLALCGCSVQPFGGQRGVGVLVDSEPIDNILMSAERRAHLMMVRSKLAG